MRREQRLVDRLNDIGVRWAESRHKTFHCITPDCGQWWFTEQVQGNNIVYCEVRNEGNLAFQRGVIRETRHCLSRVVNIGFV